MDDPEACIKREAEEETGYRVDNVRKIFEVYMSPGAVTEKLYFFVAEYSAQSRVSSGGGEHGDGEDIEVLETGEIADAKTIMLLQYAALHRLVDS